MSTATLATIFDFDGVIADTEHLHCLALNAVLEPRGAGFTWDQYQLDYIGFDDRDAIREGHRAAGVSLSESELAELVEQKAQAFIDVMENAALGPLPGVEETVKAAAKRGPVALCTGAVRSDVLPLLTAFGLLDCFEHIVTAEDVERSKPDPASYRLAAEKLGVDANLCLAIEDTPTGLLSARGAGCQTVGVTTTHTRDQLMDVADRIVDVLSPDILQ